VSPGQLSALDAFLEERFPDIRASWIVWCPTKIVDQAEQVVEAWLRMAGGLLIQYESDGRFHADISGATGHKMIHAATPRLATLLAIARAEGWKE
jgi:hypothetical protein